MENLESAHPLLTGGRYMANKRGYEKPPYKLPDFIEQTGIAKIREAVRAHNAGTRALV